MTLEDYIRDQERKANATGEDIQSSAQDAWDETKEAGREATDALNG